MSERSAVAKMAKLVAAEVAGERMGEASQQALELIGHSPELAMELLALLIKEGGKKHPNDSLLSACGLLLGRALEHVRYAVDRKSPDGLILATELREALSAACARGHVRPLTLHMVLHLFAAAKLDMGDELRDLMQRMIEADTDTRAKVEPGDWSNHLAALVEELEGDAFAIHEFLDETVTAMPEAMRAPFIAATFTENEPALREACIGFLCSAWSSLRYTLAELIEEAAPHGYISPTMLRRMIALRNWLPAEQRSALDGAIKVCRQARVVCETWPKAATGRVCATGFDGSGGHSVFVILSEGRTHTVAAMFGKIGVGIRDAWVKRGLTKAELTEIERRFSLEAFLTPTTLDYAMMAARGLLAMNLATATMPPFGMLEFAEITGLSDLNPEAMPTERLLDMLFADVSPEQLAPETIAHLLKESARWPELHPMLDSWFEDSEEVRQLMAKRGSASKKTAAVLAGPLESRRNFWAQLLSWSAFAMRHQGEDHAWQSFAIVGREVLDGRPLSEIGLMHAIADATVAMHRRTGFK